MSLIMGQKYKLFIFSHGGWKEKHYDGKEKGVQSEKLLRMLTYLIRQEETKTYKAPKWNTE